MSAPGTSWLEVAFFKGKAAQSTHSDFWPRPVLATGLQENCQRSRDLAADLTLYLRPLSVDPTMYPKSSLCRPDHVPQPPICRPDHVSHPLCRADHVPQPPLCRVNHVSHPPLCRPDRVPQASVRRPSLTPGQALGGLATSGFAIYPGPVGARCWLATEPLPAVRKNRLLCSSGLWGLQPYPPGCDPSSDEPLQSLSRPVCLGWGAER